MDLGYLSNLPNHCLPPDFKRKTYPSTVRYAQPSPGLLSQAALRLCAVVIRVSYSDDFSRNVRQALVKILCGISSRWRCWIQGSARHEWRALLLYLSKGSRRKARTVSVIGSNCCCHGENQEWQQETSGWRLSWFAESSRAERWSPRRACNTRWRTPNSLATCQWWAVSSQ